MKRHIQVQAAGINASVITKYSKVTSTEKFSFTAAKKCDHGPVRSNLAQPYTPFNRAHSM